MLSAFFGNILVKRNLKQAMRGGLTIGKGYYICSLVDFGSEPYLITIGDNVRIAPGVRFITHDGGVFVLRNLYPEFSDFDVIGRIVVGNNVHIGNDSIIMPGITIGDNVVIGSNSVVTKDIPSNVVVAGVPAKIIESLKEYKIKVANKCVRTHQMSSKEKRTYCDAYKKR